MTHWIASSNRDNWEVVGKKHVWGVPKRNKNIMQRVKPGDTILFFVRQEKRDDEILPSAIAGAYTVESEPYEDRSRIFVAPEHMGDEVFPCRVKVEPAAVFAEPLAFKPLIPDLAFVTNKTMWTGHLRQAMREIPEEDYRLVLRRAGRGA